MALRIETFRSLAALHARFGKGAELDALNLAARRPCPFSTFEYLETFLAHDEYARPDDQPLMLAAFEGERLVAFLPLCVRRERFLGLPYRRLGLLITHDTDRPHAVARAGDERRCCEAFYQHLFEHERGWSFLELAMQDAASGLHALPPRSSRRFYARRFETMPNSTLMLPFRSLDEYLATLPHTHRKTEARWCRTLIGAGHIEVVSSSDPRARLAMLELYLDLERRSWKELAHAGIRRDLRRVRLFRALCAESQPMQLGFDLVLLDGLPVSGTVCGAFAGGLYGLETAFDQDHAALGPGHLAALMLIRRAIVEGYRSVNFDGNYAYYKARMGSVVTETSAVQVYKVGSLPWLRARGGELRRWLSPPPTAAEHFNPDRRKVSHGAPDGDVEEASAPARPPRLEERARVAEILRSLAAAGVALERLEGSALEHALPFLRSRKAAA
jgi:CelD/BcsL family acetyltransferase involved in cellulose biosynthesis